MDEQVDLDTMHCNKTALGKASLPLRACFMQGKASRKAVHVQFSGGS